MASPRAEDSRVPYPAPGKSKPPEGPPDKNTSFQDERVTSLPPTRLGVHMLPVPSMSPSGFQDFDTTGQIPPPEMQPRVITTFWEDEDTLCFQVEARGVCVARREDNDMINGTKLLNVFEMLRGRRDRILKSEKVRHVVKIGPLHLKGVWVPFGRALALANEERVTELLYPLFVHNIRALLHQPINQTNTKQAMISAERRKQEVQSGETQQPTQTTASFLPEVPPLPIITSTILPQSAKDYSIITESKMQSPPLSKTSTLNQADSSPTSNKQQTEGTRTSKVKVKTGCNNCKCGTTFMPLFRKVKRLILGYRQRRIKCDEKRPSCSQCTRSKKICTGYPPPSRMTSREVLAFAPKLLGSVYPSPPTSEESFISIKAMKEPSPDPFAPDPFFSVSFALFDEEETAKEMLSPAMSNHSKADFPYPSDKKEHHPAREESTDPSKSPETSSSPSTSSSSSGYDEPFGQKEALLNRLMDYFYFIFSNYPINRPRFTSHGSGVSEQRHEDSQPGMRNSGSSSSPIGRSLQQSSKRRSDEDDDVGESERRPSKVQKPDDHSDRLDPRLACPFFKKNPGKYRQRGSCTGPGWATAHRVKEHIYRNHTLPITCPRCHEEFENDRLKDQHFRASEQCEVQERIPVEGIDSTQKELLRRRQRTHKYMTEVEKWHEIYLIIFPDADPTCLPSPYYEYPEASAAVDDSPETEFSRYEQFLRRELPSHVQRQLERRIEERLNPIEESLRSELVGIIRDTQIHLFDTYRSLRSSRTETSGADAITTIGIDNDRGDLGNQEPQRVEAQQLEDELQTFYQPPLLDDPWGFDDGFNGLLFDVTQMPPGSVDLDSGYWSMPQADMSKKESDL